MKKWQELWTFVPSHFHIISVLGARLNHKLKHPLPRKAILEAEVQMTKLE